MYLLSDFPKYTALSTYITSHSNPTSTDVILFRHLLTPCKSNTLLCAEILQDKKTKVKKQEKFMGIKLKHNVFPGGKRGGSTPTTSWKIGLAHSDGSLVHVHNYNNTLSARTLGANLNKAQTHIKAVRMNKGDSGIAHCNDEEEEERFQLPSHMADTEEQPTSAGSLRRHIAATLFRHHQFVGINGHALQPVSLASPSSSPEVAPYYSAVTPASPLDLTDQGGFSYNVKTSAELLKVLNLIWSLEEQHAANLSLMKTLQRELEHSQSQIEKLLQEKRRGRDIYKIMEHNSLDTPLRRAKEQVPTRNAVLSVRDELESERKLRKQSESLFLKLAQELSQVKSSFSNSLEELKRERKARILLENLCDEFAKGITDYEQKARFLKHRPDEGLFSRERPDQLILHISESWLDERMQMKLAATPCGTTDKSTIVEKLSMEIESFLQSKQPVVSRYVDGLSLKKVKKNSSHRYSLESFHLNDAASAPRDGDCEEDSTGSVLNSLAFNKHSSGTRMNGASKLIIDRGKDLINSDPSRNKIQTRDVFKCNEYHSSSQNQSHKHSFTTVSCDVNNVGVDKYKKSQSTEASKERKQTRAESHDFHPDDVLHSITRNHSVSRNDGKLHSEKPCTEDSLDHSASSNHPMRITTSKPEIPKSSNEGLQIMKKHSLKARLLEAKLESRHSLMKYSKAPIY